MTEQISTDNEESEQMKRKRKRKGEEAEEQGKEAMFIFSCSCVSCYQPGAFQLSAARSRARHYSAGPFIQVNWTDVITSRDQHPGSWHETHKMNA
jgi:hypothetical protein